MSKKHLSKLDAPTNILDDEKILDEHDFIVSKTDKKGSITYCNRIFVDMAGYSIDQLLGANHNLIRHPDMPKIAFKVAWDLVSSGEEFFGFVKNLRKNGGYYWVFAYITADYDTVGNIVGYSSFRRRPKRSAIEAIAPVYAQLVEAEKNGGMEASGKLLGDFLEQNKTSYNELVFALQNAEGE